MSKLLPCPFCGGEAEALRNGSWWCVACRTPFCCDVGKFDTEAEAIEAWNSRAERTCRIETLYGNKYCTRCDEMVGTWDIASELYVSGNMVELWNYCPNCGARVEVDE